MLFIIHIKHGLWNHNKSRCIYKAFQVKFSRETFSIAIPHLSILSLPSSAFQNLLIRILDNLETDC